MSASAIAVAPKDQPNNQQKARGQKRMTQLADELQARREVVVAGILAGLRRPATELDKIAASHIATMHARCEQLEAVGRNSLHVRQMLAHALVAFGLQPATVPPAPTKIDDRIEVSA